MAPDYVYEKLQTIVRNVETPHRRGASRAMRCAGRECGGGDARDTPLNQTSF
jgi:hypothetical protein